eukprot:TRINITY_DN32482_c0_g1_i1.p1 TRINITY_DN32482_c0_g1~~TRINITY_DN32482_c0_g1_i1.p1  ORF type:complete len:167 (-),score=44.29 TRINITY_DN32482_c0_g1_i1:141-641(-)
MQGLIGPSIRQALRLRELRVATTCSTSASLSQVAKMPLGLQYRRCFAAQAQDAVKEQEPSAAAPSQQSFTAAAARTVRPAKKKEKKKPPATSAEVEEELKKMKNYWVDQDHPLHRRILSQWGGLIWFGSFCLLAWLGKKWGELEMDEVEREASQPKKRQRAEKYVG